MHITSFLVYALLHACFPWKKSLRYLTVLATGISKKTTCLQGLAAVGPYKAAQPKVNSNTIELIVHTSCYFILTLCYYHENFLIFGLDQLRVINNLINLFSRSCSRQIKAADFSVPVPSCIPCLPGSSALHNIYQLNWDTQIYTFTIFLLANSLTNKIYFSIGYQCLFVLELCHKWLWNCYEIIMIVTFLNTNEIRVCSNLRLKFYLYFMGPYFIWIIQISKLTRKIKIIWGKLMIHKIFKALFGEGGGGRWFRVSGTCT